MGGIGLINIEAQEMWLAGGEGVPLRNRVIGLEFPISEEA